MMNNYYVYEHRKADTGEVFYIGKGTGRRAYRKDKRSQYWKNIEAKHGRTVHMIAENIDEELALLIEVEAIDSARKHGVTLCNMTDGGEGSSGYKHSLESLSKISKALKGREVTEENKAKLSELLKSGNHPVMSEETRAKNKGENHWAYGLTGENNPNYGRKDTPEIIETKRQRMLGRKMGACPEERKEKIRQATKGRKVEDTAKFKWKRERVSCPHCGVEGIVANMKRWHFDNCKTFKEVA